MSIAYFAIGSNQGDSIRTIRRVVTYLEARWRRPIERSPLFVTAPMYDTDQPEFVNGVLRVDYPLAPYTLLAELLDAEARFGRVRDAKRRFGARTVDLDVIDFAGVTYASQPLQLPHPRAFERPFVLAPLAALAPEWTHPTLHQTAEQLLGALGDLLDMTPLSWADSWGALAPPNTTPREAS